MRSLCVRKVMRKDDFEDGRHVISMSLCDRHRYARVLSGLIGLSASSTNLAHAPQPGSSGVCVFFFFSFFPPRVYFYLE